MRILGIVNDEEVRATRENFSSTPISDKAYHLGSFVLVLTRRHCTSVATSCYLSGVGNPCETMISRISCQKKSSLQSFFRDLGLFMA